MHIAKSQALHWLYPSPDARRLLWHIFALGAGPVPHVQRIRALDKPGAHLLWVEAGAGELRFGSRVYSLRPGPKFWLYSAQDRVVTPLPGAPFINNVICFGGPSVGAWLQRLGVAQNPEFEFDPAQASSIRAQERRLLRVSDQHARGWEWEIHLLMNQILQPFLAARGVLGPDTGLPAAIVRVLNAVAANPARDWKTTELARVAGMSYTRLRVHFRQAMHETMHDYLQRTRLNLAREWLSDPDLRIREIAERLHFTNEYYFSTFFRRETGHTPSEYRLLHTIAPRR